MTVDQLWDLITKEGVVENFDKIYHYFREIIPVDLIEDPGDILTEIVGHLESQKEFGKLLMFIKLLQDKQPELHINNFDYIDDVLIEYYAFHHNKGMLKEGFRNFIKYPVQDYDKYLHCFNLLLYYGHNDILIEALEKNLGIVVRSDALTSGAASELTNCIYMLSVSDYYKTVKYEKEVLSELLAKRGIRIADKQLEFTNNSFNEPFPGKDIIIREMEENILYGLTYLGMYFVKYMYEKGIGTCISGSVWHKFSKFLPDSIRKFKNKDRFFIVTEHKYKEFLRRFYVLLAPDNTQEMVAVLWGSVYIYDFFKSTGMIDDETYNTFSKAARSLKCKVMGECLHDLWKYDFVHFWTKPDSITEKEFAAEQSIFRKSFALKSFVMSDFIPVIEGELQDLGELAELIIKSNRESIEKGSLQLAELRKSFTERGLLDEGFHDDDDFFDDDGWETPILPVKVGKKIGRNEPCPCGSGKKYKKCCGE